ncbi:ScbA/BarX family gamma-butyrolactone biosynthesis protein [Streptomyces sp. NPDC059943]|uniref:ScbA/BarX family gamma-butyrolactone biosynthesis protein n=1 Tax=Streptomyces sp. NPDC059943 TaxID=3347010 RepID=UPI00365DED4C
MSASTSRTTHELPTNTHTECDTRAPGRITAPRYHPTLTTTVPREFVHRTSIAEVLLTSWERVDEHRFTVTAQWPRAHSFYTHIDGHHDPLLAVETIRQTGLLLAHTEYGVPLDHHLLLSELDVTIHPPHLRAGPTPPTLHLDVTCTNIKQRRGTLTHCRININIYREGHLAATGGGSFTCINPKIYQRLRTPKDPTTQHAPPISPTAPETPHTVGRTSPNDVVLTPINHPNQWHLRINTHHPTLFDHPLDHVPGMLLLEAARQATTATLQHPTLPHTITSEFTRYVEVGTTCVIEARRLPASGADHEEAVLVTAHQDGTPAFRATITTTPPT